MDPVAHTFAGAALAAAGLRRATPLAAAALVLGANAPDVDARYFAGSYEAIAFRRGWTHGVLAVALWPFVLAACCFVDRGVRRRRDPTATPARGAAARGVVWLSSRIPRSTGSTTTACAGSCRSTAGGSTATRCSSSIRGCG
jgi:inner membrane protein